MAKFLYRMQNILNIKYQLEEQAKMEYAQANLRLQEEEEKMQDLLNRKKAYEEESKQLLSGSLNVLDIRENRDALSKMQEYIKAQEVQVREAEKLVIRAMKKLTGVMQERKAQEKLKENAFQVFLQEENAKESKEIDELVSFTYGKRRREGNHG